MIPKSATDPQPGNQPYHIPSQCSHCQTSLVLFDLWQKEKYPDPANNLRLLGSAKYDSIPELDIWWDEWICPKCQDGIHFDWPKLENSA